MGLSSNYVGSAELTNSLFAYLKSSEAFAASFNRLLSSQGTFFFSPNLFADDNLIFSQTTLLCLRRQRSCLPSPRPIFHASHLQNFFPLPPSSFLHTFPIHSTLSNRNDERMGRCPQSMRRQQSGRQTFPP